MKTLLRMLLIALMTTALLTGCEEDTSEEETTEETEESSEEDEEANVDGEVVEDEQDESAELDDVDLEGQKWLESESYGIKIAVPEAWTIGEGEEVVSATDEHESTTVLLGGSRSDATVVAAIQDLKSELSFKDIDVETGDVTQLGGIPAHYGEGTAVMVEDDMDTEIQFIGYVLRLDGDNVTIMIFSEATMFEAKRDVIEGLAQTVRRI